MNQRHYPILEADFIKEIEPYIAQHYKRPGRPPAISLFDIIQSILFYLYRLYGRFSR